MYILCMQFLVNFEHVFCGQSCGSGFFFLGWIWNQFFSPALEVDLDTGFSRSGPDPGIINLDPQPCFCLISYSVSIIFC